MKKKVIVLIGVMLVAVIAITVFMKRMGGSSVGIDNNPESEVKGDSNVLVAYFSWSGNGQKQVVSCSVRSIRRGFRFLR